MIHERIVEAFQYIICKFLQLILRQVQSFHQFVKHYLVDIFTNHFVLASITYNIHSREIGNRRKNSMGTPYDGARPHYMLDIDNTALLDVLIPVLAACTPLPKPRKKKAKT